MDLGGGALGPYDLLCSVSSNASDGFQLERVLVRVCRRDFFSNVPRGSNGVTW